MFPCAIAFFGNPVPMANLGVRMMTASRSSPMSSLSPPSYYAARCDDFDEMARENDTAASTKMAAGQKSRQKYLPRHLTSPPMMGRTKLIVPQSSQGKSGTPTKNVVRLQKQKWQTLPFAQTPSLIIMVMFAGLTALRRSRERNCAAVSGGSITLSCARNMLLTRWTVGTARCMRWGAHDYDDTLGFYETAWPVSVASSPDPDEILVHLSLIGQQRSRVPEERNTWCRLVRSPASR